MDTLREWLDYVDIGRNEFAKRIAWFEEASKLGPPPDCKLTQEISMRLANWTREFPSLKHQALKGSTFGTLIES